MTLFDSKALINMYYDLKFRMLDPKFISLWKYGGRCLLNIGLSLSEVVFWHCRIQFKISLKRCFSDLFLAVRIKKKKIILILKVCPHFVNRNSARQICYKICKLERLFWKSFICPTRLLKWSEKVG